ncbi:ACP S-malonyltransferase [Chamaesiphon polymorphus]|uniref:Malonyl CoA-acyl carrier protein transacylase n=1 Tax=Chamaesiphon polymorphus CCALA 037 TaxID=2107692 RepID=A0A2T1F604_9CYAN|nr:ACP S-malonyltransferase [Chamaesiphon polymorphus]PSB40433.1 [acyl-carrier-protein] S-malonyltransferase [Chamaesiphon polymorphus CCALA 037]
MKTAWVFPGQGSQVLGMGIDLIELDSAKKTFDRAAEILGWSVVDICQNDEEKLANTRYTQPCLYVIESILVDALKQRGLSPDAVAGHSLGEYVALYAAGVFDFETGLELVKRRAELMDLASEGGMTALIGFDRDKLEIAIAESEGVVIANDNSTAQVVISGTSEGIAAVVGKIKVKRAIPLNVSGAFHSPLMATAATEFGKLLAPIEFRDALIPVLSNVAPTPTTKGSELKAQLDRQITGSVRWREISLQLAALGIEQSIEVGPGKVLNGLIKRTCEGISTVQMGTRSNLESI